MSLQFAEAVPRLAVCGHRCPTGFEFLNGQAAGPVILLGNLAEGADDVFVLSFGEKVFRRFLEPNYRDS
jgi:hypothetical protein